MIRILFIGREAASWSGRVGLATGGAVETDAEKLPAAGIRRIDESPPDAIVVVAPESDARLGILLEGIRSRPVGGLAPLILLAHTEPPSDVADLCDARLGADVDEERLIDTVRDLLGLEPEDLQPPADQEKPATVAPARPVADDTVVIPLDDAGVERKLREVRHENYFTILEVTVDAPPHKIRDAFQTQARRFAPANVSVELERRWEGALDEIRDAIEDAWAVLGNDALRERYARYHR